MLQDIHTDAVDEDDLETVHAELQQDQAISGHG